MRVYLIMDLDNLIQHELIEVRATEEAAQGRVDELNDLKNENEESASWIWDPREVRGFLGDPYVVDVEEVGAQYAVKVVNPDNHAEVSAATSDAELGATIGSLIADDLISRKGK